MRSTRKNRASRSDRATRTKSTTGIAGGCALLLSLAVWSAMPDDAALEFVVAMADRQASYTDIVLTLIDDGRSLPEATGLTMRTVREAEQRTQLVRTALCMSVNVTEAELVTNAAISAVPPGDAVVEEFVSEFVKYQRSSCLATELTDRPPVPYATGGSPPVPTDTIACTCRDVQLAERAFEPPSQQQSTGSLVPDAIDVSTSR